MDDDTTPEVDQFDDLETDLDLLASEGEGEGDQPSLEDVVDGQEIPEDAEEALSAELASLDPAALDRLIAKVKGLPAPDPVLERLEVGDDVMARREEERQARHREWMAFNEELKLEEKRQKERATALAQAEIENGPSSEEQSQLEAIGMAEGDAILEIADAIRMNDLVRARRIAKRAGLPMEMFA